MAVHVTRPSHGCRPEIVRGWQVDHKRARLRHTARVGQRPASVNTARIVAGVQTLGFAITSVVGFAGVVVTEAARLQGRPPVSPNGWYALGGEVGMLMGFSALAAALAVGIPLFRLARPRPGARTALVLAELLLLVPWVLIAPTPLRSSGSPFLRGMVLIYALAAITAVLGLLVGPTTAWLRANQSAEFARA
jgi:hypothetical protein